MRSLPGDALLDPGQGAVVLEPEVNVAQVKELEGTGVHPGDLTVHRPSPTGPLRTRRDETVPRRRRRKVRRRSAGPSLLLRGTRDGLAGASRGRRAVRSESCD